MTASQCYQAGDLDGAIQAALAAVKKQPTDVPQRFLLAELLCFAGELERADKQLDMVMKQDVEVGPTSVLLRQLIRAETARRECFQQGRLPEFVGQVTPALRKHLDALIAVREGDAQRAADLLAAVDEDRPEAEILCNGQACSEFRDLDDTTASFLEVLTSNGTYYWVPFERIDSLTFHQPVRPHDLLWRRTEISVVDGPDGEVYVPATYFGSAQSDEAALRLGRQTIWSDEEGQPIRGTGRRMFLVGDDALDILQIQTLQCRTESS